MSDIDETRRVNIRAIEKSIGSASATAKAVGMSLAQYLNLRDGAKDSKTGKPRGMRKETARKFEKGTGKPSGWLDVDHTKTTSHKLVIMDSHNVSSPRYPKAIEEVIALMQDMTDAGQAVVLDKAKEMQKAYPLVFDSRKQLRS